MPETTIILDSSANGETVKKSMEEQFMEQHSNCAMQVKAGPETHEDLQTSPKQQCALRHKNCEDEVQTQWKCQP